MEEIAQKIIEIVTPFGDFTFSEDFQNDGSFYYKDGLTMQTVIEEFDAAGYNCKVDIELYELMPYKCAVTLKS